MIVRGDICQKCKPVKWNLEKKSKMGVNAVTEWSRHVTEKVRRERRHTQVRQVGRIAYDVHGVLFLRMD